MGLALNEADEMIALAKKTGLKFTIGYTQRFNPKNAYVKKYLKDGTLGAPVTALVSRNVSRSIGNKIAGGAQPPPAAMRAAHGLRLFRLLPPAAYTERRPLQSGPP